MFPFLQHFFANMHQHAKVQRFFATHVHGCAYMGCGFIKLAHQTENTGQVKVGVVIIRGQFYNPVVEQKGQVWQSALPQPDAEVSEHVFMCCADIFCCFGDLFKCF